MRGLSFRLLYRLLIAVFLAAWAAIGLRQSEKHLPPGVHITGDWRALGAHDVHFLRDLAAADATGAPLTERQINTELLHMIGQARELLVLDTGLFGDLPAAGPGAARLRAAAPVAASVTDALLQARQQQPDLRILMLIDPASVRLQPDAATLQRLRQAGIAVVPVNAGRLRAPDAAFLALFQLCCRWWNPPLASGSWPNPLGVGPSSISFGLWGRIRGYQRAHRQLLIGDDGAGGLTGLIFSRPLNAEASLHSAVALQLSGDALAPLLESEFVVAQFSGWTGGGAMQERAQRLVERQNANAAPLKAVDSARARVVSEEGIADVLVQRLASVGRHDSVDLAALYLSDRDVVRAVVDAATRGATVRVLLDPGKDGYGYSRSGVPNRQVGSELVAASDGAARVRWYRTHGEQFSPGLVMVRSDGRCWLLVGTAELTRSDVDDFNLAAAFVADLPAGAPAATDAQSWFDTLWGNRAAGGVEYSADVDVYADASQVDYWKYRVLEASGASFD
ncbi:MAG TPA: phospholipase D-like domain-containing protein [Steroidobacteraceae bacterium]|jgi:phosphatidylserine/phosphatidylglycerophosphate/cardiolipin synthase-like enzyme